MLTNKIYYKECGSDYPIVGDWGQDGDLSILPIDLKDIWLCVSRNPSCTLSCKSFVRNRIPTQVKTKDHDTKVDGNKDGPQPSRPLKKDEVWETEGLRSGENWCPLGDCGTSDEITEPVEKIPRTGTRTGKRRDLRSGRQRLGSGTVTTPEEWSRSSGSVSQSKITLETG